MIDHIFVIDDDAIFRSIVAFELDDEPAINKVSYYKNGLEGLEALKALKMEEYPEIILLDINMPVMDGFQFLEAIQGIKLFNPRTKIVILSTTSRSLEIEKAFNFKHVEAFLEKPFTDKHISRILKMVAKQ
jgi:CheY-like chemotaxis protein